jgi:hypothetical protein
MVRAVEQRDRDRRPHERAHDGKTGEAATHDHDVRHGYQDRSKMQAVSPAHWHEVSTAKTGPGTFIMRKQPS